VRPGVDVISRALPPPASAPTDTGVCFIVGATTNTDTPYALVHSLTEFVDTFGDRGSGASQATYDAVDVYFREGGSQCIVGSTTSTAVFGRADEEEAPAKKGKDAPEALVVDAGIANALAGLTADLGPGQILIADATLAAVQANQSALLAHAAACNRVALLTCADGTAAQLQSAGQALQQDANGRYGALFAPSAVVPGVVAGTTRTVPYSAVEAGIIARNDLAYNPNQAAAGVLGQTLYAIDVNGRFSDLDYENLNNAGVNMARIIYGGVRTYGYRALVDPVAAPTWLDFGWARLNMAITAEAEAIGQAFVFSQLDGQRRTISNFGGELAAMLNPFWASGALYGTDPLKAYAVDVGVSVNTDATIANGELHAVLSVRMSGMSEWVEIEIVKVASNQSLPGTAPAAIAA